MTVIEAATLLEVKPATVYALCRAGMLGHLRIGVGRGTIRIELEDVDRFRAEARAKGAAPKPTLTAQATQRRPATVPTVPLAAGYQYRHIKR